MSSSIEQETWHLVAWSQLRTLGVGGGGINELCFNFPAHVGNVNPNPNGSPRPEAHHKPPGSCGALHPRPFPVAAVSLPIVPVFE